jgi:molybdate transport system ATP-binding protein
MLELALDTRLKGFRLQIRLTIGDEIAVLYGPSGAGKSLTLLAIAGLIRPASGSIRINGRTVFDSEGSIDLPPHTPSSLIRRSRAIYRTRCRMEHRVQRRPA